MRHEPYMGSYSVRPADGAVVVRHDGHSDEFADWLRSLIWSAQANEHIRRRGLRPPKYDIDPLVVQLRQIRQEQGVSCRAVGEVMLIAKSRVAEYERGVFRPRLDVLRPWAYVLGYEPKLVAR